MKRQRKDWDARLLRNAERTTVRHRHRWLVTGLASLTMLLAVAGLFADLSLGAERLGYACYGGALVAGVVLFALLYSKPLRVTRHPDR